MGFETLDNGVMRIALNDNGREIGDVEMYMCLIRLLLLVTYQHSTKEDKFLIYVFSKRPFFRLIFDENIVFTSIK